MKLYFLIFNIFLGFLIITLGYAHIQHEKPPPDKILGQTPVKPDVKVRGSFEYSPPFAVSRRANLAAGNIFDPHRGEVVNTPPPAAPENNGGAPENEKALIELVGICKSGSFCATLLIDKTVDKDRQRSTQPKPPQKKYFKVGEFLNNGYEISEINFTSVVFTLGAKSFTIDMKRNDAASKARNENQLKLTPVIVASEQTRSEVAQLKEELKKKTDTIAEKSKELSAKETELKKVEEEKAEKKKKARFSRGRATKTDAKPEDQKKAEEQKTPEEQKKEAEPAKK